MASESVKLEREKRRTAAADRNWEREKLLYERVLTPNVVRLLLIAGIIAYATHEARSESNVGPVRTALSFALPGIGIPLIAADAGIRDKWALAAISATATGYVTGQMIQGWLDVGVGDVLGTLPGVSTLQQLATLPGESLQRLWEVITP